MLDFLVTSRSRRRLLQLLWTGNESGSVKELAERAGVGFASAWRELRAMQAIALVVSSREGAAEVFAANTSHPLADALRSIVVAPARTAINDRADRRTRSALRALGAPLLEGAARRPVGDVEETIVRGVQLAHHDPAVARSMPVCLYRQRNALRPALLEHWARQLGEKRSLGFFCDLTSALSKDPRFVEWAAGLRDRRCVAQRDFFPSTSRSLLARQAADLNTPAAARRWGLRMNLGMDAFTSTFEKFRHAT